MTQGACDSTNLCVPGDACLSAGMAPTVCYHFCDSDNDCTGGAGAICTIGLNDMNGMAIPNVTLCSLNCDPIGNGGCQTGARCSIFQEQMGAMRDYTSCGAAGTGTQGTTCTNDSSCAPGFMCLTDSMMKSTCYKVCDTAGGACPNAMTCTPINGPNKMPLTVGATSYGACL